MAADSETDVGGLVSLGICYNLGRFLRGTANETTECALSQGGESAADAGREPAPCASSPRHHGVHDGRAGESLADDPALD